MHLTEELDSNLASLDHLCEVYLRRIPFLSPHEQRVLLRENQARIDMAIAVRADFCTSSIPLLLSRGNADLNSFILIHYPSAVMDKDLLLSQGISIDCFLKAPELLELTLSANAEAFIDSLNKQKLQSLINSPYCPKAWLVKLISKSDPVARASLASNPHLSDEAFSILYAESDYDEILAENPSLPGKYIEHFARSDSSDLRLRILRNSACPEEILGKLIYDSTLEVSSAAFARLHEFRSHFDMRLWVQGAFGFKSKTVMRLINDSLRQKQDLSWLPYAAALMRWAYNGDDSTLNEHLDLIVKSYSVRVFHRLKNVSESYLQLYGDLLHALPASERLLMIGDVSWTSVDNQHELFSSYQRFRPFVWDFLRKNKLSDWNIESSRQLLATVKMEMNRLSTTLSDSLGSEEVLEIPRFFPEVLNLRNDAEYSWDWPKTAEDLQEWGTELSNCLAGFRYAMKVGLGLRLILGLRDSRGRLCCAIEIDQQRNLIQARIEDNESLPLALAGRANRDLLEVGLLKEEQAIEGCDEPG